MKHRSMWVAALALLGMSSLASANFKQNDWELTLSGSGGNDREFRAGGVAVNGSLGYFLTDDLELSLRQTVSYSDGGQGQDSVWNGSTRGAVDFNFDFGAWRPFIGANVGYVYGDTVSDTWEAAPEAGLKWFANDTTFIYGMVEYQFFFKDSGEADDAFDDGQFVYSFGIGFRF